MFIQCKRDSSPSTPSVSASPNMDAPGKRKRKSTHSRKSSVLERRKNRRAIEGEGQLVLELLVAVIANASEKCYIPIYGSLISASSV